jgi:hypothetical protein
MARRSSIEHALVASVRNEHCHGPRIRMRCRWRCSDDAVGISLLSPLALSGLFSSGGLGTLVCGQGVRCSWVDLRVSLLVLYSGGFKFCLAPRGESLVIAMVSAVVSRLLSPFSDVLALVAGWVPSSSSPEPDGRLLIEGRALYLPSRQRMSTSRTSRRECRKDSGIAAAAARKSPRAKSK